MKEGRERVSEIQQKMRMEGEVLTQDMLKWADSIDTVLPHGM